ncbi:hypothetical protein Y032_0009g397 [Ancylostoma ceylanicum]|uniref:Major sperm protein n=1 Tax=Ancylostoma ceylanicum TaxID=53326 RepID=A0A016VJC6_9BILA|nr:hypothetical protein Y032_0009g397 [Ancylostoma ceylanicum]
MSIELKKSTNSEKARLIAGHATHRAGQEPMIGLVPPIPIALSDMEYVMRTARSARCSTREREPGCTCCCHLKSAVTVSPRTAHFSAEGGLSMHNIMNMSKSEQNLLKVSYTPLLLSLTFSVNIIWWASVAVTHPRPRKERCATTPHVPESLSSAIGVLFLNPTTVLARAARLRGVLVKAVSGSPPSTLTVHVVIHFLFSARLAIKITCSDNTLYRVTPVYAIVEPEEVIVLNIGRIEGVAKKDRLGILMIDYSGTGNAKDAFKRSDLRPVTINIPLIVKEA